MGREGQSAPRDHPERGLGVSVPAQPGLLLEARAFRTAPILRQRLSCPLGSFGICACSSRAGPALKPLLAARRGGFPGDHAPGLEVR